MRVNWLLACAFVAALSGPIGAQEASGKLDPNLPYQGVKSKPVTYQVDLCAVVTPPYMAKVLRIWMPIPPSDAIQEVAGSKFSTFPMSVEPKIDTEPLYGNKFAYFEFSNPQGAQMVRHQFTVKTWEVNWNIDPAKVPKVASWPKGFQKYLRSEPLIPVDDRFLAVARSVVPESANAAHDLTSIMRYINKTMKVSHVECSLQASAIHALEKKIGHCSDYHGLGNALSRSLGYPTRMVYGINPLPKPSPSHCKLEAYLPNYGWVCFDISETQQLISRLKKDDKLTDEQKQELVVAAVKRTEQGFRDNTWFLQTRGSDYELAPPASRKVAVVRTIYAEADGVAYPEPDPANPKQTAFSWMTMHRYSSDRPVTNPFQDWKSLQKN